MKKEISVADAINNCFQSPNVIDSNWEAANVVDCLDRIANGLFAIAKAIEKHNQTNNTGAGE